MTGCLAMTRLANVKVTNNYYTDILQKRCLDKVCKFLGVLIQLGYRLQICNLNENSQKRFPAAFPAAFVT